MMARCLAIGVFALMCVSILISPGYGRIDPGTIAGVWLFDENNGDRARDSSGSGNDGTIFGAGWAEGKFGSALEFDGEDDYVDMNENVGSGSVLSVCFWVNPGELTGPARNPIVNRWKNDTNDRGFEIRMDAEGGNGNDLLLAVSSDGTGGGDKVKMPIAGFYTLNEWQHVAVVFDAGNVTIYKDGEQMHSGEHQEKSIHAPKTPLAMGRAMNGGVWDYFKGLMDEVAVFEAALTEEDVGDILNQGLQRSIGVSSIASLAATWASVKTQR